MIANLKPLVVVLLAAPLSYLLARLLGWMTGPDSRQKEGR